MTSAEDSESPLPPGLADFELAPPIVVDVDRDTMHLITGDFDSDGQRDFAVFDTTKNLLRILYARDLTSEEPYEKEEMVIEQVVARLSAGDLNGDGRDDVLIGCDPPMMMLQKEGGRLDAAQEMGIEGAIAMTFDVNGDGRDDVVSLKEKTVRVAIQGDSGEWESPRAYQSVFRIPGFLDMEDINGDGRLDMVYSNPESPEQIVVRFQSADGVFGQERLTRFGAFSTAAGGARLGNGLPGYVVNDSRTGVLRVMQYKEKKDPPSPLTGQARIGAYDIESPSGGESVVIGDLDGCGRPEIAITSPEMAELQIYRVGADAILNHRSAPTLLGVTQALIPDGKGALWMLSPTEKALGVMTAQGQGESTRFDFPKMLGVGGEPMAFAVAPFGGAETGTDLVVCSRPKPATEEDGNESAAQNLELTIYRDVNPAQGGAMTKDRTIPLPKTDQATLEALLAGDLNNDGRSDVMCFFEYEEPRVLLQKADGAFRPLDVDNSVGAGMLSELKPSRIRILDFDGDGKNELLVSNASYARVLRIAEDGAITVLNQFNGKNSAADIAAAVLARLEGDDKPFVVLLDTGNRCLTFYGQDENGGWELIRSEDIQGISPTNMHVADMDADGKDDLLLTAMDRLALIPGGRTDPEMQMTASHISDIEKGMYVSARVADLNNDGIQEMIVLEGTETLLDFLTMAPDASLKRFYRFQVFEGPDKSDLGAGMRMGGMSEPRDMEFEDMNGDGKTDVVALCHREVLIYLNRTP